MGRLVLWRQCIIALVKWIVHSFSFVDDGMMDMSFVELQLSGASVRLPLAAPLLTSMRLSLDMPMQTDWTCWAKSLKLNIRWY